MLILGIESSCDETAAAVLADDRRLLANVINSQIDVHAKYGGVVPELASRHHLQNIYPVVQEALDVAGVGLDDLDGIAVTQGPGLIGSLLVGLSFAKALSFARGLPYVGVDHLRGHMLSVLLGDHRPDFPYIALVASGGHSSLFRVDAPAGCRLLGRSRDDAAGEAFDKVAKLLGLPYPGGPVVSRLAAKGAADAIPFPRSYLEKDSLDFSFSGVKTAVANHVNRCRSKGEELDIPAICASFQEAVVEVLAAKTMAAAAREGIERVVVAGGVAANPRLREVLAAACAKQGHSFFPTPPAFCTDNAAMIALAGSLLFAEQATTSVTTDVYSRSPITA